MTTSSLPANVGRGGTPCAMRQPCLNLAQAGAVSAERRPRIGVVQGQHLHPRLLDTAVQAGEIVRFHAGRRNEVRQRELRKISNLPTGTHGAEYDVVVAAGGECTAAAVAQRGGR